jgi:hypothetical protein
MYDNRTGWASEKSTRNAHKSLAIAVRRSYTLKVETAQQGDPEGNPQMPRRHKTPSVNASPQEKADAAWLAKYLQPAKKR